MTHRNRVEIYAWGILATIAALTAFALTCVAATAAAQPASLPAALGAWDWCVANASWLVPLVVTVLSTLATGLSDYPKASGAVKALRLVVSVVSLAQFRDGVGSLKLPGRAPAQPPRSA